MSDSEYSDEPEEVQAATPPLAKKMAPSGTAAARSGGSGLMVGVGVAAAVAVVGAVGLKLFLGKSNEARPGRAANASTKTNKTRGSPAKKTVQRRAAAVSPRANAAAATAPAPSSSTSAASTSDESATQVRSPLRSAAPVLPKRPTPKPKAATTAPAAAATEEPAATSAATAATAKASAEAHAARQAADREAAEAAAAAAKQKAAAEAAAEKKAAAEAAAKDKAAKERAAAEAAAKEKAAAEQAAKDKAAKDKAATEVAAKEKAVAEAAAKEKTEKQQAEADKDAADAAASQKAAATAATAAAAATAASVGGVVAAAAGQPSSTKEPSPAAAKQQQPAKQQPAAKAAGAAKQDSAAKEQERPAKEQPAARKPAPAKEQSAAKQQPAAKEQPAAKQQPAAEEQAGADGEAEADAAEAPAVVHVMPRSSDIAGLLVSLDVGDAAEEGAAEEKIERLADIPCPPLSFEGVDAEGDLNEIEQKARQMSLHAHKLVKENNNIVHGTREQKAALDFLLAPENAGKARPHLVAACAFALGDMLLAQQKVDETKAALAIAYQTSTHIEDKGPQVKALMNYAYILKSKKMTASARDAYEEALALARQQHGPLHGMVEKVKYELTAFLGGSGREAEAANLLIASAAELLTEAERLAAEEEENGGKDEAQQGGEAADEAAAPPPGAAEAANGAAEGDAADPGTGFEHLADEQAAAAAAAARGEEEEGEELTPVQQAQHFAMRNLMNAAGVLDGLQQYERSEALLAKALDIAVATWGTGTVQQLNVMYALAQHFRRRGQLQESIDYHEGVLAIMDESIQVYSPELLQNRISILRDTAVLLDQTDQVETAIDYATGALVNAQTLAGIVQGQQRSVNHPMLEPFYRLLADLKLKFGDEVGAAEARRQANGTRLTKRIAQNNTKQQRAQKGGTGSKRAAASGTGSGSTSTRTPNTGASTARAGGRRV